MMTMIFGLSAAAASDGRPASSTMATTAATLALTIVAAACAPQAETPRMASVRASSR